MTNRIPWVVAAIALCATAAPRAARADDYYYDSYGNQHASKDPWQKLRFEGTLGALVGSQRVGYVAGSAGGMHLDLGARLDRMMLYGEYDFLSVGESSVDVANPVRGFEHRFGADFRYSLAAFGGHGEIPVRGDLWAEVGAGEELVYWHEGGKLGRKDVSFGFGAQATFRIGHEHPHYLGIYYAMKAWVAESPPRKDDMPQCAGPCDEATGPSPWDFGIFFNFGVPFGK